MIDDDARFLRLTIALTVSMGFTVGVEQELEEVPVGRLGLAHTGLAQAFLQDKTMTALHPKSRRRR